MTTIVVLFVGVLSMRRDLMEGAAHGTRRNRLMVWRMRLQLIIVLLMPLWYLANRG